MYIQSFLLSQVKSMTLPRIEFREGILTSAFSQSTIPLQVKKVELCFDENWQLKFRLVFPFFAK